MQWDRVENKGSVVVYAGGALVLLWFSSTIVSAVNAVPLVQASSTRTGVASVLMFIMLAIGNSNAPRALSPFELHALTYNQASLL